MYPVECQSKSPASLNILLVDDEELSLELVKHMLRHELNAVVTTDTSAASALRRLKQKDNHFDLIISDWEMPEIDGLHFLIEVKNIKPELPFLMVTGNATKTHVIKAMKAGISGYLVKPFTQQGLLAKVEDIISQH